MFLVETSTALPDMLRLVEVNTYSLQYHKLFGISLHMGLSNNDGARI